MTSIGKSVYNVSGVDNLSFGIILEEKTEGSWKWFRVKWVNQKPSNTYSRLSYNPQTGWFRADTIRVFDPNKMISTIRELIIK